MPDPLFPKPIVGKFSSLTNKSIVRVENGTTGEEFNVENNASGKCVVDANNFDSGYTAGDVIRMSVAGVRFGSGSVTTNSTKSPQTITITTTAESTTLPAVNI